MVELATKNVVLRIAAVMTLAGAALVAVSLQSAAPPTWRLPEESTGLTGLLRRLISVFDQADIVALGEWHGRIRLDPICESPWFVIPTSPRKCGFIVVEFGSTTEQSTLTVTFKARTYPKPNWSRSGRQQPKPTMASGTNPFTRTFSQMADACVYVGGIILAIEGWNEARHLLRKSRQDCRSFQ